MHKETEIFVGDCREILKNMQEKSIDCVVTSPPYFGLRDYDNCAQIGLEKTVADYVQSLVQTFSLVHRVLKDEGTCWLNLGDSYASFRDGKTTPDSFSGSQRSAPTKDQPNRSAATFKGTSIKHKDILGIPWRVAFALQEDGWYLRQDIVWQKNNPRPESVKDRFTKTHEYLFLLTKRDKYFFNAEAVREPTADKSGALRNRRSVITCNASSYRGAHTATFPESLIEPCIIAGCPAGGTVLDPFFGSGTVGVVAQRNKKSCVGIELNPKYAEIARSRIS